MDLKDTTYSKPLIVENLGSSKPIKISFKLNGGLSAGAFRTLGCGTFSPLDASFRLAEDIILEQVSGYEISCQTPHLTAFGV